MTLAHRIRHFDTARLALLLIALVTACGSRVPAKVVTANGRQVEIATAGAGSATGLLRDGISSTRQNRSEMSRRSPLRYPPNSSRQPCAQV